MKHPTLSRLKSWLVIAPLSAALAWACTSGIIPATGEKRFVGFSWQEELKIGKQASKEVAALFGVYEDPKLERYVQEVGQRVLAKSHLRRPETDEEIRKTPITFRVLDSPTINAMALPGGYIYVTRGLLAHLNGEDQLAVVLGHMRSAISRPATPRGVPGSNSLVKDSFSAEPFWDRESWASRRNRC